MTDENGGVVRPDRTRDGTDNDRGSEAGGGSDRTADRPGDGSASNRPAYAPPADESFDWRGWVLVGLVFVCFLVIPGAILLLPAARGFLGSLGLSLRDAYLTLPLVPALLLGAVAVWSALASRRS